MDPYFTPEPFNPFPSRNDLFNYSCGRGVPFRTGQGKQNRNWLYPNHGFPPKGSAKKGFPQSGTSQSGSTPRVTPQSGPRVTSQSGPSQKGAPHRAYQHRKGASNEEPKDQRHSQRGRYRHSFTYDSTTRQTDNYLCLGCQSLYNCFRNNNGLLCGRVPRILTCGHTICEECIMKALKNANNITCFVCSESVQAKNLESFSYNYFIVGQIVCTGRNVSSGIDCSDIDLVSDGYTNVALDVDLIEKCGLGGCQNPATVDCIDCQNTYCGKCNKNSHNTKALMRHQRKEIEKISLELKNCPDHSLPEDLKCDPCNMNCCCYCMLEKHEGHTRKYLRRLTKDEEAELELEYEQAKITMKKLQLIQQHQRNGDSNKVSDDEMQIKQRFADIHAELYLIEREFCRRARDIVNSGTSSDKIVRRQISKLDYLIDCFRTDKNKNLRGLLENLKEMNMLFTNVGTSQGSKCTELVVDDRIKNLGDCFKLKVTDKKSEEAVEDVDLSHNVVGSNKTNVYFSPEKDVSCLTEKNVAALTEKNVSSFLKKKRSDRSSDKKSNTNRGSKETSFSKQEKDEDIFTPIHVQITHINSLESFYVRFKKDEDKFLEFQRDIKCCADETEQGVMHVFIEEIYLAPYPLSKDKWERVQVLKEIEENGERKFEVIFLDYGYISTFANTQLKLLSKKLSNFKPFAVHCRLHTMEEDGCAWIEGSHSKLLELLYDMKEVNMVTKYFTENIYTVDLFINTSLKKQQSVIELLYSDDIQNNLVQSPNSRSIFDNSDSLVKGEWSDVFVKYVRDPWNVFIQNVSYETSSSALKDELSKHYQNSKCDINFPVQQTDVAVLYPLINNGEWHRARILAIDTKMKTSEVFFLDLGMQVNVSWDNLRWLATKFKRTECLVIPVRLADIEPKVVDWSENLEAIQNFFDRYMPKQIKMLVSQVQPLEVVLFERFETYDENINSLLVANHLVTSSGKLSSKLRWPRSNVEEVPYDSEFLPIYKDFTDDSESEDEFHGRRLEVELVKFDDPYSIYVMPISMKKRWEILHEELQMHYHNTIERNVGKRWNYNEVVVVFDKKEKCYCRGKIKDINNKLYTVDLIDECKTIIVQKRDLREISDYFLTFTPHSVLKCHMANIKPAGDSNKWSKMSIDWFQNILNKNKSIHICKIGNDKLKASIPICMWYTKVILGSALEPSICKFISIEKRAVEAGLAFKLPRDPSPTCLTTKSSKKAATPKDTSNETCKPEEDSSQENEEPISLQDDTIDSFENTSIEESAEIFDWKPPSPLRSKEFNAYITCVEIEGYMYIRNENLQPVYLEIEEEMKNLFDSIPKCPPKHLRVNQMVTIWSDQKWYRGSVISVIDERRAKVMMIDFGSDHIVDLNHLHKKVMYPDLPQLVSKIKLYDVHSKKEQWTTCDIELLLRIVKEYSKIVIKSSLQLTIPLAEVYDVDGVSLNEILVQQSPNLYRRQYRLMDTDPKPKDSSTDNKDGTPECDYYFWQSFSNDDSSKSWNDIMEEDDDTPDLLRHNDICSKFQPGAKTPITIIAVKDWRTVSLLVGDDYVNPKEFQDMSESIQREASDLESIENLKEGVSCISFFKDDRQWYRAEILDVVSHEYANVFYVDYGNFELVHTSLIKEMKPDWFTYPVRFYIANIDITVLQQKQVTNFFIHLKKLEGISKIIETVQDMPLRIHIYEDDCESYYYEEFLERGIIKINPTGE